MIAPPVSAYLLTDRLPRLLGLSVLFGVASAVAGYWLAHWLDASISGAMATTAGLIFLVVLLFAPERGLVAIARRRSRQRWEFAQTALAIHLFNHEDSPEAALENRVDHLSHHLRWTPEFAVRVVRLAEQRGLIHHENGSLALTESGRRTAQTMLAA
jgi:manganese/zinc/iron transport system permease protein